MSSRGSACERCIDSLKASRIKKDKSTLSYRLPRNDHERTVLQIPGTHALYVGPSSCMRRHSLAAQKYGNIEDVSFLRVTQADVVSGGYEELIAEAVEYLLKTSKKPIHAFFIELFCIDDFLGTDDLALMGLLESTYPACRFITQHIHPVAMNEALTMSDAKHFNMYSLINAEPPEKHDNGITVLGAFVPFNPESELHEILRQCDRGPLRYLFTCDTFEEYQDLGKSRLSLVARSLAQGTAEHLSKRLGIPFMFFNACYDIKEIERLYARMACMLEAPMPDIAAWKAHTEAEIAQTLALLGETPLAVDCQGTLVPFALSRALLDYGFNVRWVYRSKHLFDMDAADRDIIGRRYQEVRVMREDDAKVHAGHMGEKRATGDSESGIIAIGRAAEFIKNTPYCVNIWHDEGLTGFHGVCQLMRMLREQFERMGNPDDKEGLL